MNHLRAACGLCLHFLPFGDDVTGLGSCKRYPPTVLGGGPTQALPQMAAVDWCGEFSRSPAE